MEIVKDVEARPVERAVRAEPDVAEDAAAPGPSAGVLSRLLAWRPGTQERALAKDPTLWMHRDVTT